MEIDLDPDLQKFIEKKLQAGESESADDVVNGALRLLKDSEDQMVEADIEELRRDVQLGIDQVSRGESAAWDVEDTKARLLERLARRRRVN